MGITALSGPHVVFGLTTTSSGGVQEYNEERAPSVFDLGQALMDPRPNLNYSPGGAVGTRVLGLWDNVGVVDAVPSVQNSSNGYRPGTIVSCLTGSSLLTTLTLNTSAANGITYTPTITAPESGQPVTPALAIDSTSQYLTFGSGATVAIWNPSNAVARCIAVAGTTNSSQDDSSVTLSVYGRDIYGFKMTETITLSSLSITTPAIGKKAFKYIHAMTLNNSSNINSTNINIGFADRFGFPTRVDTPLYVNPIMWTSSNSSATTVFQSSNFSISAIAGTSGGNISFALSTGTAATATTSDVRGTWLSTTSWVANQRLQLYSVLNPVNLATVTSTNYSGIFGMPQFSSN